MSEEDWVKEAMTDAMLVAEVLLSLVHSESPARMKSAKNNSSSPSLQLDWSVRQRRSKQALRKKGETARASPTTPLSWSGGTSVSGGAGADGSEESSRPPSKPVDNARSKVVATNETTPVRSRRKKTLAELKEEMSSHSKENNSLKNVGSLTSYGSFLCNPLYMDPSIWKFIFKIFSIMLIEQELEMVKLKFENLRTTNETLRRKLKFEKERAMGESSKRIKVKSFLLMQVCLVVHVQFCMDALLFGHMGECCVLFKAHIIFAG
ncbi:hypothetical protein DITRI_Ditri20bG0137800 [Diplodiscus trichospermus]